MTGLSLSLLSALLGVLFVTSCANATDQAGKIIATDEYTFYRHPGNSKKVTIKANPAIIIAQKGNNWFQIMAVNGQTAWINGDVKALGLVKVGQREKRIELTKQSTEQLANGEHHWQTIESRQDWKLLGATGQTFHVNPAILETQGRGNLLPADLSPYELPELEIKSASHRGWATPLDLVFSANVSDKPVKTHGIFIQPFLGLLQNNPNNNITIQDLKVLNLSFEKFRTTNLPKMDLQPEVMLLLPATTNSQIENILLTANAAKNTYVLRVAWKNRHNHYLAYSGWTGKAYEQIATPILIDYQLKDQNKDGIDDLSLKIAHINGDGYSVETLLINGKYQKNHPAVSIHNATGQ
ncbi:MAG: hypothetical protein OEZ39_18445 [Gammaproteobacteria bacterium]|nr:hypothetical protein [Gammaproteobacteria bacterium]MDH5653848.1 hypothetical protein [Gammaproteobacteria bacterium]